jgi:hypothetical protein
VEVVQQATMVQQLEERHLPPCVLAIKLQIQIALLMVACFAILLRAQGRLCELVPALALVRFGTETALTGGSLTLTATWILI